MSAIPGRLVYRPVMGRVLTLCYAAFAVWWLVAGLLHDGPGVSWAATAWLIVVGAVMYAVLWRPAVVVDADGVLLLNVLRDVRVPWGALEAVETRYALTLVTPTRTYASWAAGAPGRGSAVTRLGPGRAGSRSASGAAAGGGAGTAGDNSGSAGEVGTFREAGAAHLPRRGWIPGGVTPDRSSRDLRTDSGAAAFMVEQAWVGWRERPQARAEAGTPTPPVGVSWNVPVVAGVLMVLAVALLAGVVGI